MDLFVFLSTSMKKIRCDIIWKVTPFPKGQKYHAFYQNTDYKPEHIPGTNHCAFYPYFAANSWKTSIFEEALLIHGTLIVNIWKKEKYKLASFHFILNHSLSNISIYNLFIQGSFRQVTANAVEAREFYLSSVTVTL